MRSKALEWWFLVSALALAGCSGSSVTAGAPDASKPDVGGDTSDADVTLDAPPPDVKPMDVVTDVTPDAPADTVPTDTQSGLCRDSMDCASNELGMRVCDTTTNHCVACTATNRGSCTVGQYCTAANRCEGGCAADSDCGSKGATLHCNTTAHACVECTADDHCGAGMICTANRCVTGCNTRRPCGSGQLCCEGACLNIQTDATHCGTCTTVCAGATNAAPACSMGACLRL